MRLDQLATNGFEIVDRFLNVEEVEALRSAVADISSPHRGGARNLLQDSPTIANLAAAPSIVRLAADAMGREVFAVRALFFSKSPEANWNVSWHQDTAIAVTECVDIPGFNAWSVKDGVPHVQPPTHVLEHMVALRVHLDDCGPDHGPLRVLPGSHRHGKLTPAEISRWRNTTPEVTCCCAAGGVLVLKPLLLHASSRNRLPAHRRVIHIEYADGDLPDGLRWFEAGGKSVRDH